MFREKWPEVVSYILDAVGSAYYYVVSGYTNQEEVEIT